MVRTAMNIYAGEGVARSLYYHRAGEVLDRSALNRLKTIQEDSTLERGTAAETLIDDLRYTSHNLYRLILCIPFCASAFDMICYTFLVHS